MFKIPSLLCVVLGHQMTSDPNVVACDSFNVAKTYQHQRCERCAHQEILANAGGTAFWISPKPTTMFIPKAQWDIQIKSIIPDIEQDMTEANRLLMKIMSQKPKKFRSIDDPWES